MGIKRARDAWRRILSSCKFFIKANGGGRAGKRAGMDRDLRRNTSRAPGMFSFFYITTYTY